MRLNETPGYVSPSRKCLEEIERSVSVTLNRLSVAADLPRVLQGLVRPQMLSDKFTAEGGKKS